MHRNWPALLLALCLPPFAVAKGQDFSWSPPAIGAGLFNEQLGMLEPERDEYADSLATHAANRVAATRADKNSLAEARRLIALALHLSPRNRKALVLKFQLSRGVLPEPQAGNYQPEVLASLLATRAEVLKQQGGEQNGYLARIFIELAAELNPTHDDTVYASELQRIDHGPVDWSRLTDAKPGPVLTEP